ncbi:DUF3349 domain-containing protein [Gordonia westfalica]|uniref:DUF3349 domain-containing protein n=1 Tax=Gordonia westfalica TaxID=158898 RepID=A0A1H2JYY3_9ACTN|nr:DUF3349 domain-containing protein [Gordonia westfalica]MDS1114664.1 DUF3349 domain-containing protein [Gordonia westfalica]SDU61356.1 Protein of unknown function [Gordonia westfalica]
MSSETPLFESVINWIRKGYPDGVSRTDFPPLMALLRRVLTEEEVTTVALQLVKEYGPKEPVTKDQIAAAIERVIDEPPTPEDVDQVAGRLAAVGWPLVSSRS